MSESGGSVFLGFVLLLTPSIVCAWGAAAIAKGKGRPPAGWAILGFFFPIIGLIIAACVSNLKKDAAEKLAADQIVEAQHGRRLAEMAAAQAQAAMAGSKPCPFCAEPIRDVAIKCRHCGSDLTAAAP